VGGGRSFKFRVELQYCIFLGPLFWESPHLRAMGFILHLSFMVGKKNVYLNYWFVFSPKESKKV
jgi:hypothetical protein